MDTHSGAQLLPFTRSLVAVFRALPHPESRGSHPEQRFLPGQQINKVREPHNTAASCSISDPGSLAPWSRCVLPSSTDHYSLCSGEQCNVCPPPQKKTQNMPVMGYQPHTMTGCQISSCTMNPQARLKS